MHAQKWKRLRTGNASAVSTFGRDYYVIILLLLCVIILYYVIIHDYTDVLYSC